VNKYGKKIKCILSTTVPLSTYDVVNKAGMGSLLGSYIV